MRSIISSALICVAVTAAVPFVAHASAKEDNATLYMDAIALPKKARVCAAKQSDFAAKFEPAFAKWRSANKTKLASGERAARATAKARNMEFSSNVEAETDIAAEMFERAPEAQLQERCADLLAQVLTK
jgi:hypothetical protein